MSLLVPINGQNYIIPETNEVGWGSNLDDFFVAISAGTLQKNGGSFTLSAETDFGASFGLKSLYYKSRSSNIAATGIVRLANNSDSVSWRNAANSSDLALTVNATNQLCFNGTPIESNSLTSAHILVGNGSNIATDVAMSGNIGIDNTGATTIQAGAVVNSMVNTSAAIAYSKLNLTGGIVNADVNASAAIAYSKLNLSGSIVNADVNTSAAIAYSKLALTGSIVNADISASAAIAYSKLNLSASIVNADISSSAAIGITKIAIGTANQVIGTNNAASANEFKTLTATANQVSVTHGAGTITFATPQDIGTASAVQHGSLALGGTLNASSILSLTSTSKGFLPPVMTTTQKNAISTPTDGLIVYDSSLAQLFLRASSAWTPLSVGGGSGTVASGTANQLTYYASSGTTVSGLTAITASRALASDANGLPVAATTTATELGYVNGVTSAIQTQLNLKAPLASPTFTGVVTVADGSVAAPSIAFASNPTTGFSSVANSLRGSITGVEKLRIASTEIIPFVQIGTVAAGGASAPDYSWDADLDCGMYRIGANDIGLATNGTKAFELNGSQNGQFFGTNVDLTNSGDVTLGYSVTGTSNTSSANSRLTLETAGGSAGDSFIRLYNNVANWSHGLDNSDSDAWCLSNASTLNGTNLIRATATKGVEIQGTTTNDSATAGFVGETVLGNQATFTNFPTSTQWGDLVSISLTAGDWLVWGTYQMLGNAGTTTEFSIAITTTTGNSTTGFTNGLNNFQYRGPTSFTSTNDAQLTVSALRFSLTATTTVYLKYEGTYTSTAPTAAGNIRALRIR